MNTASDRPSRVVPILVAVIGAAGLILAAWIGVRNGGGDEDEPAGSGETATEATDPGSDVDPLPDLSGEYRLDPDNERLIVLEAVGEESYRMWEKAPAAYPFQALITYESDGVYRGDADFTESQAAMIVEVRPRDTGVLATDFIFTRASDGSDPEGRVDHHELTPP